MANPNTPDFLDTAASSVSADQTISLSNPSITPTSSVLLSTFNLTADDFKSPAETANNNVKDYVLQIRSVLPSQNSSQSTKNIIKIEPESAKLSAVGTPTSSAFTIEYQPKPKLPPKLVVIGAKSNDPDTNNGTVNITANYIGTDTDTLTVSNTLTEISQPNKQDFAKQATTIAYTNVTKGIAANYAYEGEHNYLESNSGTLKNEVNSVDKRYNFKDGALAITSSVNMSFNHALTGTGEKFTVTQSANFNYVAGSNSLVYTASISRNDVTTDKNVTAIKYNNSSVENLNLRATYNTSSPSAPNPLQVNVVVVATGIAKDSAPASDHSETEYDYKYTYSPTTSYTVKDNSYTLEVKKFNPDVNVMNELLGINTSATVGVTALDDKNIAPTTIDYLKAVKDVFYRSEVFTGTNSNDLIAMLLKTNGKVNGGSGDDTITGGVGNDAILGGAGTDSIAGGLGNDAISAGASVGISSDLTNDTLDGGSGNDTIDGSAGDNSILGGAGDDSITDDAGDDSITGGAGNDSIRAGAGNDTIFGGAETDSIFGEDGSDVISAGESVGVSRDLTDDTLDGGDGNDTIDGSAGNNSIIGDEGDDSIRGGAGNDTILGGSGTDSLFGGEGDDVMSAGESLGVSGDQTDDTLDGGDGNDTIDGSAGDNAITGGAGNDILTGGKGSDRFNVDAGTDTIVDFSLSEDTINLSPGASVHIYTTLEDESFVNWKVTNTTGTERSFGVSGVYSLNTETKQTSYDASYAKYPVLINGSRVADTIIGGAVDDSIDGGIGHDKIDGGLGNDTIKGGSGNDSIRGGEGSDIIIGGTGADAIDLAETVSAKDVVVYTAKITAALKFEVADTIKRASSDTITGFVSGADKIQLSLDFGKANGPLVKAATGGYIANAALKAEDFVAATAAMTGTAADVAKGGRFYVTIETVGTTKNTVLNFDANGDSVKAANASEVTGTTTDDFVVLKLIGIPAATAAAAITPVLVPADIIFA